MTTPEEYGRQLAEQAPPLSPAQAHAAARIFASVAREQDRSKGGSSVKPVDSDGT
jgi:hypothetical protein